MRYVLALILLAGLAVPAVPAAAQGDADDGADDEADGREADADEAEDAAVTERARALFFEGVEHSENQRWAEAAQKFREALELKDAPPVRFNLAVALVELGEYTQAAEQLDLVEASSEASYDLRNQAGDLRDVIRSNTARLTIRMQGATGEETIFLDGDELPRDQIGQEMVVRPIRHMVLARRRGRTVAREEVILGGGQDQTVMLQIPAPTPAEVARAEREDRMDPLSDAAAADAVVHWTAFGSVAAVVIAAVVVTLVQ